MKNITNKQLENREYVFPFLWMKGQSREYLKKQLLQLSRSGIASICLESRTHPDFCGDGWWSDLDIIFEEAKRLGITVWLFDDKHCPTGSANGTMATKYQHLRGWHIAERHFDVIGGGSGTFMVEPFSSEDEFLGVCAFERGELDNELLGEPHVEFCRVKNQWGEYNLPKGVWRIFTLFKTRAGIKNIVDVINPLSVKCLIDEVYEKHYARYSHLFGNIIAGFFSDEPYFGNNAVGYVNEMIGYYNNRLGIAGLGYPWRDDLPNLISENFSFDVLSWLPALWYDAGNVGKEFRAVYMDKITSLYSKCFSGQLGDWCEKHGVEYIGHVVEDNGTHARLGYGTGHYFRSMEGQSMAGIDVVFNCVQPGFAHYDNAACCEGGYTNSAFFHYVLGQLAASDAKLSPKKGGRSVCEIFGAYGWAEDIPMMKWLVDFFLVRGINHFIPHAFSPIFPDKDCPPHFGVQGLDPQYEGFCKLMDYTNKMADLLSNGERVAKVAVMYDAELEWSNRNGKFTSMEVICKKLLDNHICYDIIPSYLLDKATVEQGKIKVDNLEYTCLAIGAAEYYPTNINSVFTNIKNRGATVLFVEEGAEDDFIRKIQGTGACELCFEGDGDFLRYLHIKNKDCDHYMFFNESLERYVKGSVFLSHDGKCVSIDMMNNKRSAKRKQDNGGYEICLQPYQSVVYSFGNEDYCDLEVENFEEIPLNNLNYIISLAPFDNPLEFEFYKNTCELINITGVDERPDFSGHIAYDFDFEFWGANKEVHLYFEKIGSVAHLLVNGMDCGTGICEPYVFNVTQAIKTGNNKVRLKVSNTLVHSVRDKFSSRLPIRASGMQGVPLLRLSSFDQK